MHWSGFWGCHLVPYYWLLPKRSQSGLSHHPFMNRIMPKRCSECALKQAQACHHTEMKLCLRSSCFVLLWPATRDAKRLVFLHMPLFGENDGKGEKRVER